MRSCVFSGLRILAVHLHYVSAGRQSRRTSDCCQFRCSSDDVATRPWDFFEDHEYHNGIKKRWTPDQHDRAGKELVNDVTGPLLNKITFAWMAYGLGKIPDWGGPAAGAGGAIGPVVLHWIGSQMPGFMLWESPAGTCHQGAADCDDGKGGTFKNPDGGSTTPSGDHGSGESGSGSGSGTGGETGGGSGTPEGDNHGGGEPEHHEPDTDTDTHTGTGGSDTSTHDDFLDDSTSPDDFDPVPADVSTPYLDADTQTALQQCQEREEHELWNTIGSTDVDPDAASPEDRKLEHANRLLRTGICDTEVCGASFCQTWKDTKDNVHRFDLAGEYASIDAMRKQFPLCPEQLVTEFNCHLTREEVDKRYVVNYLQEQPPGPGEGLFDLLLQPGSLPERLPKLFFEAATAPGLWDPHPVKKRTQQNSPDGKFPKHIPTGGMVKVNFGKLGSRRSGLTGTGSGSGSGTVPAGHDEL